MRIVRLLAVFAAAVLVTGCATTAVKRTVSKKKIPSQVKESYALVEDSEELDREILKRGNKARGLSEY